METTEAILEAMKKAGEPMSAGQVADATGIDRKEIDKALARLKKSEEIVSPKRCYWQPQ
ncbi:MAG: transcriptional regulator [Spirochaetales bacterium]|nr:transcriptional regulator [Spirochaetales bacterium]